MTASAFDNSFFQLFQIEPSTELDIPSLEATYHRLSLKLHPDCHTDADLKTRLHLLDKTAQLNEAYATLSNPARRALYVLKLCGVDLEDKQASPPLPPPSFLSHLLELREALQQASVAGQVDTLDALEKLANKALQKELASGCQCLRNCLGGGEEEKLQQAAVHLVCMRYWQRFLADVEHFQEELFS